MAMAMAHEERATEERRLLDLNMVAYLTCQSRAEVEREITRGALRSCKRGRRRLVTRAQLDAYIAQIERMSA